jgi:outer membrane protein OmpA-like peptidoglycan-associated protein
MHQTRHRRLTASLLLAGSISLGANAAHAETGDVSINVEGGVGYMLSSEQRDKLDFGLALEGAVRPGLVIAEPLTLQLTAGSWWFPSDSGYGRATLLGFGLRLDPVVGAGRLVVDAHGGAGLTGGTVRPMFDAGLGYEFAVSKQLGIGPVLRYGQVVADPAVGENSDAKFFALAISVTWRTMPAPPPVAAQPAPPPPPPPPAPPKDTDGDGVPDASDVCPNEAPGAHPDPRADRTGCPAVDTDADGVTDDADQCVDVAAGANPDPEKAGCPDGDTDKDGVTNHKDQCPTVSAGYHPDPAKAGCPAPDKDKDSVPDASDACPDKPGSPSADPKKNGCPGLVLIDAGKISIKQQVFFATGKDTILPKSTALLKAVSQALKSTAAIKKVRVEGHTDTTGDAAKNLELSQKRAAAVREWLVKDGVEAGRLETEGYGGTKPIAPNDNEKGRAQNRRVDFVILDPAQ